MKLSIAAAVAFVSVSFVSCGFSAPANQPTQPAQNSEIGQLREKVARQSEELARRAAQIKVLQNQAQGVSKNAVKAPFDRFLLVKSGQQCLALQITEHVDWHKGEESKSRYRWFLQSDGSMDFTKPNARHGEGVLSEYKNGKWEGSDFIKQGAFNLEWSLSDWIYFPNEPNKMQFAITEWVRSEDINVKSSRVYWHSPPPKGWP